MTKDLLSLKGSKGIYEITNIEKSIDSSSHETILKIEMSLTAPAIEKMYSLGELSREIGSVDNNLYLTIPNIKLSDASKKDGLYTIKANIDGKVIFRFVTDIDDWIANEYKDELIQQFGADILTEDSTWHKKHFNQNHAQYRAAIDFILQKHSGIVTDLGKILLADPQARRKYDTNPYGLFVKWSGKQEEQGRDYLYTDKGGHPDDITFTIQCTESQSPKPPTPDKPSKPNTGGTSSTISNPGNNGVIDPDTNKLNKSDHFAYMFGYPDSTFMPNRGMTRAEVAAMLSRLLVDRPKADEHHGIDYTDISKDSWYYHVIDNMTYRNILKGYPDRTFGPDKAITRAEFAAMVSRFDKLDSGNKQYPDVPADHWAANVISAASDKGWVSGYSDGSFGPDQAITRSEVIAVTNRLLNRSADQTFIEQHPGDITQFTDMLDHAYWAYYTIMEATNGHDFERLPNGKDERWLRLNHQAIH